MIRYILISFVLFPFLLYAQENGKEKYDDASESYATFNGSIVLDSVFSFRSPKGFFPSLVNNFAYQATFPVRMKQKHLFMLAGVTVVTLTLINYDQQIDNYFKPVKENGTVSSSVSPHITELGDYYGYLLLAGYGCYSIGFHKYRAFRTSLLATQAAITAGLWIRIGKTLTGRMRPGATYGDPEYNLDHWFGPFAGYNVNYNQERGVAAFDAFPSGHTGAAFAMAAVFAGQYKDMKAVPFIAYSLAGTVAITRLIEHEHWASDVFLGGIIGYLCGRQVVENEKRLFPQYKVAEKKSHSYFYPVNYAGVYGAGWRLVF